MIRGGVSDKLGNGYEALWACRYLLEVFLANAEALTIEPIGEAGFEFSVQYGEKTEWHQCKQRSANGRWTISALGSKGVLSAFKCRLLADQDATCVFVTDTEAQAFGSLCGKAQIVESFEGFEVAISESRTNLKDFKELCDFWGVGGQQAYILLTRCRVETVSITSLDDQFATLLSAHFLSSTREVKDRMKGYIEEQLTRRITTETVRKSLLEDAKFKSKNYSVNTTLPESIKQATDRYLVAIEGQVPRVEISRPEFNQAVQDWYDDPKLKTLLVTGDAGSGKSLTVANTIKKFRGDGAQVLAFRVDRFLEIKNPAILGDELIGVEDNPLIVLASFSQSETPPILVIDQLDAVSDASGRRGAAKDVVLELLRSNGVAGWIKVIVVCRSYDLDNDTRFKRLQEHKSCERATLPPLCWAEEIAPSLEGAGYDLSRLSEQQKNILSVPVNFATFLNLIGDGEVFLNFSSGNELVAALVERANADIRGGGESWSVWDALGAVAERMSTDQLLTAPTAILDPFRNARALLCSAGLLSEDGGALQFGHESYFDFVYARRFAAGGMSLGAWLSGSEQHLFRRTQVRQILDYLRSQSPDSPVYLKALSDALLRPETRYLVKDAVARWLAGVIDPTNAELDIALAASGEDEVSTLTRLIVFGEAWFPLLEGRGLIDKWLTSEIENVRIVARGLIATALKLYPEESAKAIRRYWLANKDSLDTVLWCLNYPTLGENAELVFGLMLEVIETLTLEQIKAQVGGHSGLSGWSKKHTRFGTQLLGAALRRWMVLNPNQEPFIGDGMRDGETAHWVQEMAETDPVAFLNEIGPLFVKALERVASGVTGQDAHYADRMFTREFGVRERWGGLLKSCFDQAAEEDSDVITRFISLFDANQGRASLHYILEAIAAQGEVGAPFFAILIDHEHLFKADLYGEDWLPVAKAARVVQPFLPEDDWARFEARLFAHRPEHAWVVKALKSISEKGKESDYKLAHCRETLKHEGYERHQIIQHIRRERFSSDRQDEIDVLIRKFERFGGDDQIRSGGGMVISPIPKEKAIFMSDTAWRSAFKRYDNDRERITRPDHMIGGARELSGVLGIVAKEDPERFARLLQTLPDDCCSRYPNAILDALNGVDVDSELLMETIHSARRFSGPDFDYSLIKFVESSPQVAKDDWVFGQLITIASTGSDPWRDGDIAEDEILGAIGIEALFSNRSGMFMEGGSANRKSAWRALCQVAWNVESRTGELFSLLEDRIDTESNPDVLPMIVQTVNGLINRDRLRAFDALMRLVQRDIRVTGQIHTARIYDWLLWQDWTKYRCIVDSMIESDREPLKGLAYLWIAARAFRNSDIMPELETLCDVDPLARRATARIANDLLREDAHRDAAIDWLLAHANDPDPEVVKQVFETDWQLVFDHGGRLLTLADAFVESSLFEEGADQLVIRLGDVADMYPDLSIKVAYRLIELSETDSPPDHSRHLSLHNLGKLVMGVGDGLQQYPERKSEALDLIDKFLARSLYNTDREITRYDRL